MEVLDTKEARPDGGAPSAGAGGTASDEWMGIVIMDDIPDDIPF